MIFEHVVHIVELMKPTFPVPLEFLLRCDSPVSEWVCNVFRFWEIAIASTKLASLLLSFITYIL